MVCDAALQNRTLRIRGAPSRADVLAGALEHALT
jgi:hypothetical protein